MILSNFAPAAISVTGREQEHGDAVTAAIGSAGVARQWRRFLY